MYAENNIIVHVQEGYCFINETCFTDGESLSPEEYCFKCNSIDNEFEMEVWFNLSINIYITYVHH